MLAVLQYDSVGLHPLERLLAQGRLPVLAGLRQKGVWHRLESPAGLLAAATFPSLYTGLDVGEHGLYYPFQWAPREQRVRPAAAFAHPDTIFDRLAGAGRRSLVIDPYECRPPRAGAGVLVSGWQFSNRVVLRGWSEPRDARSRLVRRFGRPYEVDEVFGRPSVDSLVRLRERVLAAPARVVAATLELLARERFDLVWIGFPAAHIAGHQLWDLSQVEPGELGRAQRLGLGGTLASVYEAVDGAVGAVVAGLPDDADLLVLSPLGMGANTSHVDLLPGMLAAVLDRGQRRDSSGEQSAEGALWRMRSAIPTDVRARVARTLPDEAVLALTARLATRGVDWSRTRAFALPADHSGHIRLNLRGRELHGIVEPSERTALVEEIVAGLSTFEDDQGGLAIAGFEIAAERYPGKRADLLPDLVVRWADTPAASVRGVRSPRFGSVARAGAGTGRTGNHTGDAWAIVVPGVSRALRPARPPCILDVAATIAAALGVDASGLSGQPLLASP